jgi:hypothetical protein
MVPDERSGSPSGAVSSDAAASTAAAGWYPDPHLPAQQRYWDGSKWTDHLVAVGRLCPGCAGMLATDGPFCEHCGRPVEGVVAAQPPPSGLAAVVPKSRSSDDTNPPSATLPSVPKSPTPSRGVGDKPLLLAGVLVCLLVLGVLVAVLAFSGSGASGHKLHGELRAALSVEYDTTHVDALRKLPVGSPCPADATFLSGEASDAKLTVSDAAHKTVAVTQLAPGPIAGFGQCMLTFTANVPPSDFYTVTISGLNRSQNYSRSALESTHWNVTLTDGS